LALAAALAACSTAPVQAPSSPERVRAEAERLIPASAPDRAGWARDIQVAFTSQELAASRENLCAVVAVIAQESSFQADPAVANLPVLARREIERRASAAHVPQLLVDAALGIRSPNGKTYDERLARVRTEQDLSNMFEDFIGMVPLGRQLFGGLNPVHTAGPMQVSVSFAEAHATGYPYPIPDGIRKEVFTRRGGIWFGTLHILGYPADYDAMIYRFADFNAGWYASRNAAFQNAVSRATGIPLALDGDVVIEGSSSAGQTELAVRALRKQLGMNDDEIRQALLRGEGADFERTALYRKVYAIAERDAGKALPRAMLPQINLQGPKISRPLTTAWYANRVNDRWKACLQRGS
jgi:hypothetical protein